MVNCSGAACTPLTMASHHSDTPNRRMNDRNPEEQCGMCSGQFRTATGVAWQQSQLDRFVNRFILGVHGQLAVQALDVRAHRMHADALQPRGFPHKKTLARSAPELLAPCPTATPALAHCDPPARHPLQMLCSLALPDLAEAALASALRACSGT